MTTLRQSVVLVTGSTGGVGPAVVAAFTGAGARVYESGHQERARDRYFAGDLSRAGDAERVVSSVLAEAGALHIVAHVAGGWVGGRLDSSQEGDWERMFRLNVMGTVNVLRAALPRMQAGGRVMLVGAKAGTTAPGGMAAYVASKAALHAVARAAAEEVSERGITVNVLAPGVIDTETNRAAMPDVDRSTWVKPEEIASLMLTLAMQGSVSGQVILMG